MTEQAHITLRWQSSDPLFAARLAEIEAAMIAKDIDPSAFIIERNESPFQAEAAQSYVVGTAAGRRDIAYEYTVFIDNDSFKVTKYGDMDFLNYFAALCMEAADDKTPPAVHHDHLLVKGIRSIIGWLEKDPLNPKKP